MPNIILANRGQTPININTSFEDGEWWIRNKRTDERRRCVPLNKKNAKRMFVDGTYIPQSHPLCGSRAGTNHLMMRPLVPLRTTQSQP